LSFAIITIRLDHRVAVLAVARPVAAGQMFTAADLTVVPAADDPATGLIPASQAAQVVGQHAAVPLLAGTFLTRALVGQIAFPPTGQVVSSLALKPGQCPQGLQPGAQVDIFILANPSPGDSGQGNNPKATPAVVLSVDLGGDGQGTTVVVTVLIDQADSARLAGAEAGRVVLMQTAPGGD
jgi:hypothetical protein